MQQPASPLSLSQDSMKTSRRSIENGSFDRNYGQQDLVFCLRCLQHSDLCVRENLAAGAELGARPRHGRVQTALENVVP